jgi:hypothetical protein
LCFLIIFLYAPEHSDNGLKMLTIENPKEFRICGQKTGQPDIPSPRALGDHGENNLIILSKTPLSSL